MKDMLTRGLALGALVAGCAVAPARLATISTDTAPGRPEVDAVAPAPRAEELPVVTGQINGPGTGSGDKETAVSVGKGFLTLTIRWPARKVQLIPSSTRVIRVEVLDGGTLLTADGQDVAVEIVRPPENATSSALLEVPAGGPYDIRVRAYKDDVERTDDFLVAEGTSTNVTVGRNKVVPLALTLAPAGTPPTVARLVPDNGGGGALFEIVGTGFGAGSEPQPTVMLAGQELSVLGLDRSADAGAESTISVLVPDSAGTGLVVVNRDGLTNAAPPTFTVLGSLSFKDLPATLSAGSTFSLQAQGAASPSGAVVDAPSVSWGVASAPLEDDVPPEGEPPPPAAEIDPVTGQGTASATGDIEVLVVSGNVTATAAIRIE